MSPSSLGPDEIYYPDSDGQPLGDNDWQFTAILAAVDTLRVHFAERPDVYVFGDMFIYYVEGDPEQSVAPDVCVSFGVPNHKRMVYKLWEEGKAPDFVMEVASPRTWRDDVGRKRTLYERLGVTEYWRFDPRGEFFQPALQGLSLDDGRYRPIAERVRDGRREIPSAVLGLTLRTEKELVRFHDLDRGVDGFGVSRNVCGRLASSRSESVPGTFGPGCLPGSRNVSGPLVQAMYKHCTFG